MEVYMNIPSMHWEELSVHDLQVRRRHRKLSMLILFQMWMHVTLTCVWMEQLVWITSATTPVSALQDGQESTVKQVRSLLRYLTLFFSSSFHVSWSSVNLAKIYVVHLPFCSVVYEGKIPDCDYVKVTCDSMFPICILILQSHKCH